VGRSLRPGTINAWSATWITAGFDAIEALLAADRDRGDYCFGHAPTLADVVSRSPSRERAPLQGGRLHVAALSAPSMRFVANSTLSALRTGAAADAT